MQNYIYGAGGHGKVVLDAMQVAHINCSGFVDDREISAWAGLSVYRLPDLAQNAETYLHLAIGNSKTREKIAGILRNAKFFCVTHPTAAIATSASIGSGTFFAAQSVVGPDAQVGNHCIINHAAVVDHDCVVGDFSHIAPQSSLGGGVKIGIGALIGAGAVILPNLSIGNYAVVGAGAVVTKSIASGVTVIGNPAHPVK